ncbi:MAG: hypothetical protein ACRDM7_19540 [Thermoleophilaceae bacterium]
MTDRPLPSTRMDSLEAAAADAHAVQERIRAGVRAMKQLWIGLAEDLYRFNREELWRDLGYDSFEAWLATPEIELERSWVFRLISVYRELVIDRGVEPEQIAPLSVDKLRRVLPAIRRGHVTVEEALADVESVPHRDLQTRYEAMTVRPPNDPEPPIEPEAEPEYAMCPACGSRYQVRKA